MVVWIFPRSENVEISISVWDLLPGDSCPLSLSAIDLMSFKDQMCYRIVTTFTAERLAYYETQATYARAFVWCIFN